MKVIQLLANSEFKNKNVLEKVICFVTWEIRENLFSKDIEISGSDFEKIKNLYEDFYIRKKPLEYIFGYIDFFGTGEDEKLRFVLNENTLIPRPETEYMVQAVREFLSGDSNRQENPKWNLYDIGTWSWVLGISVWYFWAKKIDSIILSDLSEKALEVAKINAKNILSEKNINFVQTSLIEGIELKSPSVIVSNMPYIPEKVFDENVEDNVKLWEPRMAFVSWDDWLDLYRELIKQLIEKKVEKMVAFFEMMSWQCEILQKEFKNLNFVLRKTFHFNITILEVSGF